MVQARSLVAALVALLFGGAVEAAPIPAGDGQQTVALSSTPLEVFTYRPTQCAPNALLVVFHGVGRNAAGYRNHARALADASCMIILAPLFDQQRFPGWRYQRGGIVDRGKVQNARVWTGQLIVQLVAWARAQEQRNLDYYLIGHSAGAQFLSRVAAFVPNNARRMVIANPSTYVAADLTPAPFGMGGVYFKQYEPGELRRYLDRPITILLGEDDNGDEDLNVSRAAMQQGRTRYERGLNVFRAAQQLAQSRGWTFRWRLIEIPGVGHSAGKMFSTPQAMDALRP